MHSHADKKRDETGNAPEHAEPSRHEPVNQPATAVQCRFPGDAAQQATAHIAPRHNATGMPDKLKTGLESLSGLDLSPVRVHYNSPKPAQVGALAYAQGTNIHLGPGQERHLPHEGWHVVQQIQGRVRPTIQCKNAAINDNPALEREADRMGEKAWDESLARASYHTPATCDARRIPISAAITSGGAVVQRTRPDAQRAVGPDTDLLKIIFNPDIGAHYRLTLIKLNNHELAPEDEEYIDPAEVPGIISKDLAARAKEDITKSHYFRAFSRLQRPLWAMDLDPVEHPKDRILRKLYENGGFIALRDGYDNNDTREKFGLSLDVFNNVFMGLWKGEKKVRPSDKGLHLMSKSKSSDPDLGSASIAEENNIIKTILFQKFNEIMEAMNVPVFLTGGAVANIVYGSPRLMKDLDYRTLAVDQPFTELSPLIETINSGVEEAFPESEIEPFHVDEKNINAIDAKIDGVEVTVARILNPEDLETYRIENSLISGKDLILDKATTFMFRVSDQKKVTDLFDLLWAMMQEKMTPGTLLGLLRGERAGNYAKRVEASNRKDYTFSEDIGNQFISSLADFMSRGAQSIKRSFSHYTGDKSALYFIQKTFDGLAVALGVDYQESGTPSLIIQAGNMTGDMFGVNAALLHNPYAHVLILSDGSDRDRTRQLLVFYAASVEEGRVHVLEARHTGEEENDISSLYTTYAGRQKKSLPYDKVVPLLPLSLQAPDKQHPVSAATAQTAEYWSRGGVERMKKSWGIDIETNGVKIEAFLRYRRIPVAEKYLVLWSRFSGKRGGPHAQHDTSFTATRQIIHLANAEGYTVLIAGDRPVKTHQQGKYREMIRAGHAADLTAFWDDPNWQRLFPEGGRHAQFQLFEYLKQRSELKHLGFRSGNLEAYALLGHQVRYMEEKGNLQAGRMEAWSSENSKIGYDRITIGVRLPSPTGQWVAEDAARHRSESKPPWIEYPLGDHKENYFPGPLNHPDWKRARARLRGFAVSDLENIHRYLREDERETSRALGTFWLELYRKYDEFKAKGWQLSLKDLDDEMVSRLRDVLPEMTMAPSWLGTILEEIDDKDRQAREQELAYLQSIEEFNLREAESEFDFDG